MTGGGQPIFATRDRKSLREHLGKLALATHALPERTVTTPYVLNSGHDVAGYQWVMQF